ncbi:MAG: hypothetical protein ACI8PZ_001137 [Myxococcota bacterium]|jgi:hypothetical protein
MRYVPLVLVFVACDAWWPGAESLDKRGPKPKATIDIFFADRAKFDAGEELALTTVQREIGEKAQHRNTLKAMFKGPRAAERERGLELLHSGAEGFHEFALEDGVATLMLRGGCDGGGADLTVYDLILANLKQFDDVRTVKLLDPKGATLNPDGPGDSKPACLLSDAERKARGDAPIVAPEGEGGEATPGEPEGDKAPPSDEAAVGEAGAPAGHGGSPPAGEAAAEEPVD